MKVKLRENSRDSNHKLNSVNKKIMVGENHVCFPIFKCITEILKKNKFLYRFGESTVSTFRDVCIDFEPCF